MQLKIFFTLLLLRAIGLTRQLSCFASHRAHVVRLLFPFACLLGDVHALFLWMFAHGEQNRNEDLATGKEIRVSPYRLAAHLATAFATFSLLVHTGLQVYCTGLSTRACPALRLTPVSFVCLCLLMDMLCKRSYAILGVTFCMM